MMRMRAVILLLPASLCLTATPTSAQSADVPRVHAWVDASAQVLRLEFAEQSQFERFLEDTGEFNVTYGRHTGAAFDGGALFRLAGRVGAGASLSMMSRTGEASTFLSVPHPLRFNANRTFEAAVPVERRERALHVHGALFLPLGRRFKVVVAGGPSFFNLQQDLVETIDFEELFPFNRLQNPEVVLLSTDDNVLGFNVGADATWMIGGWLGVGGAVRFSRATLDLTLPRGFVTERALSIDLGGLRVGGGVRLAF